MRTVIPPAEADTPLVVDPDGVETFTVSLESFEPVARRDGKMFEFGNCVELGQFSQGDALNARREIAQMNRFSPIRNSPSEIACTLPLERRHAEIEKTDD